MPGAVGASLAITKPKAQFCCRLTSVKGTDAKLKLLINRNKAVCLSLTVETRWKRRNLGGLVSVVPAKAVNSASPTVRILPSMPIQSVMGRYQFLPGMFWRV